MLVWTVTLAWAQNMADSTLTILDGMAVPLVEKLHVANTDFKDNWYIGLYGGAVSNFGSDASHAGFFSGDGTCGCVDIR